LRPEAGVRITSWSCPPFSERFLSTGDVFELPGGVICRVLKLPVGGNGEAAVS